MSGDDLAAFLAARYDEAEAAHRHAGEGRIAWLTYLLDDGQLSHTTVAADHHDGYWCAGGQLLPEPASVLVVFDQAGALADIALKRAILAEHAPYDCMQPEGQRCYRCASDRAYPSGAAIHEAWPCATVRQLGTEFAGHPGYKPGWAP